MSRSSTTLVRSPKRSASAERELVDRARAGDERAFEALASRHRRELQVHCYRMVGSLHDAEDLVQETLVRAWRNIEGFQGRASLRAWLYKIATNACLNHIRSRPRLVAPEGYTAAHDEHRPPVIEAFWLEPYPDRLSAPVGPDDVVMTRAETSLAFLTAVQLLPPRQRAALILRDVLSFSAQEVAELLETSVAAINSALQRARTRLGPGIRNEPPLTEPHANPEEEALVQRFVRAWERADIASLVSLLARDAVLAMPPTPVWFNGRDAIGRFLSTVPADGHLDQIPLIPTRANGQPAVAAYMPGEDGALHAYGVMVLTIADGSITDITGFADASLFRRFDLPDVLDR